MKLLFRHLLLFLIIMVFSLSLKSQNGNSGLFYQTAIRDVSGLLLTNQSVSIQFTVIGNYPAGVIQWQENHTITSNSYGMIKLIIGTGNSTGLGNAVSFNEINWLSNNTIVKVGLDFNGGNNFTDFGIVKMNSVPYVYYSKITDSIIGLSFQNFSDVNVSAPSIGKVFKYNGTQWLPATDNQRDTVSYSYQSNYSTYANIAGFLINAPHRDTTVYSINSANTQQAFNSNNAQQSNSATYSDTALFTFFVLPSSWKIDGNNSSSTNTLGSNNNADVILKTNNSERARISSQGSFSIGNTTPAANFNITATNGLMATSTPIPNLGTVDGAGTRMMWYPSKAAFRAGYVDGNQWDSVNIGQYSAAFGYNCKARYASFASGFENEAVDNSIAIGRKCKSLAEGSYPNGNSIAIGDSNLATNFRALAIGRGNLSTINSAVVIGSYNQGLSPLSMVIGNRNVCNGSYTLIIGNYGHANAKQGCFVFSDASSTTYFQPTLWNMFTVRASGGIVFYTDSINTMAVVLNPGSGSWSSVSDRNKKENFEPIDYLGILQKVKKLDVKSWKYKSQASSIRHIGPTAQSFYKQFKLGESNKSIVEIDMDGIILASIKALNTQFQNAENILETTSVSSSIDNNKIDLKSLSERISQIESELNK